MEYVEEHKRLLSSVGVGAGQENPDCHASMFGSYSAGYRKQLKDFKPKNYVLEWSLGKVYLKVVWIIKRRKMRVARKNSDNIGKR